MSELSLNFKYEFDLVSRLVSKVSEFFNEYKEVFLKREYAMGCRIADLAIGGMDECTSNYDVSLIKLKKLKHADLRVLSELLVKSQLLTELSENLRCSDDQILIRLEALKAYGLVSCSRNGIYSVSDWKKFIPKKIFAIEAKLHHWKKAFEQARYYKEFTPFSFIALPFDLHSTLKNQILLQANQLDIGLILVESAGRIHALRFPRKINILKNSSNQFYLKLTFLQKYIQERVYA